MLFHLIDDMQAAIAAAAAAGSFTALLVTRTQGWAHVLAYFLVGQMTAFYFTAPVAARLGLEPDSDGWVGFVIGVVGILFWGGVLTLATGMRDDPRGTITWLRQLWKGGD